MKSRAMMEMLDEHSHAMPEKLYIDLANAVGALSKIERRAKRMRTRLIEYDGSDCSVLIPSDVDGNEDANEWFSDWEGSLDDESSIASSDSEGTPVPETRYSDSVVQRRNRDSNSPYRLCVHGKDYFIPSSAIRRDLGRTVIFPDAQTQVNVMHKGVRGATWRRESRKEYSGEEGLIMDPRAILIVRMVSRTGTSCFLWCAKTCITGQLEQDYSNTLAILPISVCTELQEQLRADSKFNESKLVKKYEPHNGCMPLPGPSKQRQSGIRLTGNYWKRAF